MNRPHPRKVPPMSRRVVATVFAILMTASAIVVTTPATAQSLDTVPTKPTVPLEVVPNLRQFFYLRYTTTDSVRSETDPGAQPDCYPQPDATQPFLDIVPSRGRSPDDERFECTYTTQAGVPGAANTVTFSAPRDLFPTRRVSFTGNDSFVYHHGSIVPDGVLLRVEVYTESTLVANGTIIGEDEEPEGLNLNLAGTGPTTGRVEFLDNRTFRVTLTASSAPGAVPGLEQVSPATWGVDDRDSYLEIRADNAIRAATWVTDERDNLRDVFTPIANESNLPADRDRRIVGHFALQSAFGHRDASRGDAPRFTLLFDGRAREIGTGGQTQLLGTLNNSASVEALGVAVWSFPANMVNYRGFTPGEYTLHVDKTHHQGGPINRAVDKRLLLTSQSVALTPYEDARTPTIRESQAHTVLSGSSTTYLLMVSNTGSVNDTFTINVSAPNAPAGWGSRIGGPDVLGNRITVPARETRVFTVTVNAPAIASSEVIHLVNVTSTVDPGTRSRDLTLVTRISTESTREVGVIFLTRELAVDPGVETHFPVYVWNRGTRSANVSLELRETGPAGWIADLSLGAANVDRIVLGGIPPGDIAAATLEITGPANAASNRYDVTLNATSLDAAGTSADRALTFTLRAVSGVSVQVFDMAGARSHIAELSGPRFVGPDGNQQANPQCRRPGVEVGPDCTDDGVDGLWFRVWVTNTGRSAETFQLTTTTLRKTRNPDCSSAFTAAAGADAPVDTLKFYARPSSGVPSERNAIDLQSGRSGELYVWLPVNRNQSPCPDEDRGQDFYSFVVQARGGTSGAIGRGAANAIAVNSQRPHIAGVYLEGVVRDAGYSATSPLVDLQNATKRSIVGGIRPGENTTYYVRMTNTASWSTYSENGRRAPDLHVLLDGVDYDGGWNVSIRPVLANNDIRTNPYVAEYNLTNENTAITPTRREAWIDQELEVVVQAPSPANGSVIAGTRHEFAIIAEGGNRTGDRSTLEIVTVVSELANVTLSVDQTRIRAHAGDPGAFLLYLSNNGSSAATVTLRATMNTDTTQNAAAWQVNPNAQTFPLAAFKNRSVALLVTPPSGAIAGSAGEVLVTVEYARNPFFPEQLSNFTRRLGVDVAGAGNIQLTAATSAATISPVPPGNLANFTMQVRNTGSLQLPFEAVATPIPNWTIGVSPDSGILNPGETRTLVLTMIAPRDVVNDSRFASVVRVQEDGGVSTDNFDTLAFTVNVLGGQALPRLNVPNLVKRVDRAGVQHFEVQVQNVGTAAGRLPLEVRSSDPSWLVGIVNSRGDNVSSVQMGVNELVNINVTVRAPFTVPERTVVPVEIIAYSPDQTQSSKATLSAEVHDYGVQLTLVPTSRDGLPGVPTEFTARLRNTGNDNDTLNLSVNLVDLPEWNVQLSSEEVRLEPGQELEVRTTLRSSTNPLPASRTYTFPFWVGTRGGQAVNISKNMTVSAVVTIPNYRAYDVDRDGQLEIAVDLDKRAGNGFEEFREIFSEGVSTQIVARPIFEGRTTYFLDVPRDRPYDGVADVWFNPETVHGFEIVHSPDINGDGTPDYLLDTDREGKIDKAFDSATERFWNVVEISVYGDTRIQYLVDITGDGRPDRFYDPETRRVTRTQTADDLGAEFVGIDVDDDERVDYYYNTRTRETSGAEVQNLGGFFLRYWYFFAAFAMLVLVTVVLVMRRNRAPPEP